jgi:hypothetical protein
MQEDLMLPKVPSLLLRRRRHNLLMPRRARILIFNSIRLNLKLPDILKLSQLRRKSLLPLRKRRKRMSRNTKPTKTNVLRLNPKPSLPQPLLTMLLPLLRTKENIKFKLPT